MVLMAEQYEPGAEALPGARSALDPARAIKPGRHGLPPETVAAIQRDRLIDAFVHVVADGGYNRATISKVTEAAGVTKKTFYVYFSELDDCFLAAYERGGRIVRELMARAYRDAPSWPEGVYATLRALLELMAAAPRYARFSMVEVNAAGPRVRAARMRYMAEFRSFLTDPAASPGAEPPRIPDVVMDAIIGGVYGAIYSRVEAGQTAELPSLLAPLAYFALLPLVGEERASAYLDDHRLSA